MKECELLRRSVSAYIAIVHRICLLGTNTVYRWDADVFAPLHCAVLELYPLQQIACCREETFY